MNSIKQQFHAVKDIIGADSALGYTLNKAKVLELFKFADIANELRKMGWIDLNFEVAKRSTYLGVTLGISPVKLDKVDLFTPTICRYDFVNNSIKGKPEGNNSFMSGSYTMHTKGGGAGETIENLPIIHTDGGYFSNFTAENTVGDALVSCAKRLDNRAFNLSLMPLPYAVSSYSQNSESTASTEANELRQEFYSKFEEALEENKIPDDKQFDCLIFGLYSDVTIVKSKGFKIPGVYLNVPSFMVFIRPTMLSIKTSKSIADKITDLNGGLSHFIIPLSAQKKADPESSTGFDMTKTNSLANKAQEYVKGNSVKTEKVINKESYVETEVKAKTISQFYNKEITSVAHEAAIVYSLAFVAGKSLTAKIGSSKTQINSGFIKVAFKEFFAKKYDKLTAIKEAMLTKEFLETNKEIFNGVTKAINSLDESVVLTLLTNAVNEGTGLSQQLSKDEDKSLSKDKSLSEDESPKNDESSNDDDVENSDIMSLGAIFGTSSKDTKASHSTSPRKSKKARKVSSSSSSNTAEEEVTLTSDDAEVAVAKGLKL